MPTFGEQSKKVLDECHPLLREILLEMIKNVDFKLLDGYRDRAAQEAAFKKGNSKAHFGQSAHNYKPCVSIDFIPWPFTHWNDYKGFKKIGDEAFKALEIIKKRHKLPKLDIRWGGDWHKDGSKTTNDQWDAGHIELHPWRNYVKK